MNEISIPWKRVDKGLPKARNYADDRAPTIEEIRKIVEYPDRRIKPIDIILFDSNKTSTFFRSENIRVILVECVLN